MSSPRASAPESWTGSASALRETNPELVYLSVTGFGQEGPYRELPVTDSVIQAFSGWMSINRDAEGTPQRIGMVAIDVLTGLYAYQALAGALLRKIRFGRGERLDVSLMQAAAAFQAAKIAEHHLEEGRPQVLYVPVGTMKTRDGYINITAMRERHYRSLMEVLGMPELATDPRFDTREKRIKREEALMPVIRRAFLERTTAEWARLLTDAGVMNAPVHTYGDFMGDPHVQAVGALAWLEQPGVGSIPVARTPATDTPVEAPGGLGVGSPPEHPAPGVGEHSRDILTEAGFDEAEIGELARTGAVRLGRGGGTPGGGPERGEASAAGHRGVRPTPPGGAWGERGSGADG